MKNYLILCLIIPILSNAQKKKSAIELVEIYPYLGTYYKMYVGNRMPFIDVYTEGANNSILNGKFVIDYGTDVSVIDLNGFPGYWVDTAADANYSLTFKNGTLYSGPYKQKCKIQDCSYIIANGIREAGIIGTDILSQLIVTLDYKYSRLYIVWDTTQQAKPNVLAKAGFIPVSTKGYFSNENHKYRPQQTNIPTIPIVFGDKKDTAQGLAQIDPGYDDRVHIDNDFDTFYTHIINMNKLYFNHLIEKHIDIKVDKNKYYTLNNISGKPDTLFKCSFAKEYVFNMIGTKGESVMPYNTEECNVFLKVNASGGEIAGGITTLPFPAIQFGGSFLLDCDKITFDPLRSLVWFHQENILGK